MTFLKKAGSRADTMHTTVKIVMGTGSGSSAIRGDKIVRNRANTLQIPKAVEQISVGNIYGVA